VDARLVSSRDVRVEAGRALWMEGSPVWYRHVFRAVRALPRDLRPYVVFWHSEPLPPPRASGLPRPRLHARELAKIVLRDERVADPYSNARALRQLTAEGLVSLLLISTGGAHEFLAEQQIDATFVPLALLPEDGRDLGLARDIDVLFLGALDVPRRRRLVRELRRHGAPVVALGGWGADGYWGERRTQLLNRTKILLNFPRHPGLLSGRRMLIGMANKALVLAEPIYRPDPYRPGVHFVSSEIGEMPATIAAYLADDARRLTVAEAGHDFARSELTLERTIRRILALIDERR
jgi:hypothetical protein